MTSNRRKRGFTLIEVLVVVAIIALLISILLPSLASAREQAKMAACGANQNQIGKSLMYCFNANKTYPDIDDGRAVMMTWLDVLVARKYLPDWNIGYCPKDSKPDLFNRKRGQDWGFNYPQSMGGGPGVDYSYGINYLITQLRGQKGGSGFKIDQYPSSRVFIADAFWNWMHGWGSPGMANNSWDRGGSGLNMVGWRHGTRAAPSANVLFYDGSVRRTLFSMSDVYTAGPTSGQLRGLRTGDKFFWRPGEHTHLGGWGDVHNGLMIDGVTSFNSGSEYPYSIAGLAPGGKIIPDEINPDWISSNNKWPASLLAHKGRTQ